MPLKNYHYKHNQIKILAYSLGLISLLSLVFTTPVFAQDGRGIFEELGRLILSYAGYIASFVITPIAVLALIVNVARLIWDIMTGNTHHIGSKLAWILATILLATLGVWLGLNAGRIF